MKHRKVADRSAFPGTGKQQRAVPLKRLKKRADFIAARKGGRAPGPAFTLQANHRNDYAAPRVGLTVTKKMGNAVARNLIKRRLRAAISANPDAGFQIGFDYVLIARESAATVPFAQLQENLQKALRKVHKHA
ncbi:MAG: ribonuclease P protein component [Pseudomonadota bacterium]